MSIFVLGVLRWLQNVWVVQLLVAATPLILWLRVLSYDDHLAQNLVAQEHEKDSMLSSPLPHRCACCVKVLCATLHSVVSVQTVPHLSPLSSACSCASTSCRSSSHCVSWLSESSTPVLSTFASSEDSLSPRSVTCCMSTRQRGQLSVAVEAVANSSRSGPQETSRTTRLVLTSSILRGDCPRSVVYRLHSRTTDLHAQALVTTPVEHMQQVLFRLDHRSQVFQLVGQNASDHTRCTVDRNIRAQT